MPAGQLKSATAAHSGHVGLRNEGTPSLKVQGPTAYSVQAVGTVTVLAIHGASRKPRRLQQQAAAPCLATATPARCSAMLCTRGATSHHPYLLVLTHANTPTRMTAGCKQSVCVSICRVDTGRKLLQEYCSHQLSHVVPGCRHLASPHARTQARTHAHVCCQQTGTEYAASEAAVLYSTAPQSTAGS